MKRGDPHHRPVSAPWPARVALRALARALPPADRDDLVGDLTEMYADRLDAGGAFSSAWLCAQAAVVWVGIALRQPTIDPDVPPRSLVMRTSSRLRVAVRQAVRRLTYEWRYALGVVVILTVGIGPAAAMLAIVQRVLLQPLAYQDPDRLGIVRINLGQLQAATGLTPGEIIDLRHTSGLFTEVESATRQPR